MSDGFAKNPNSVLRFVLHRFVVQKPGMIAQDLRAPNGDFFSLPLKSLYYERFYV